MSTAAGAIHSDAKRLKELKTENSRLKKLLAEAMLENEVTRAVLKKSGEGIGTPRTGASPGGPWVERTTCPACHRHECHAYRYQPAPDRNQALREQILALAHRHRRYGAGMIYLKLRQAG